jgi:Protein of unknown function (DUF3761)
MFRLLLIAVALAGIAGGMASATGVVSPIVSPGSIAEPPYDDCPPGKYRARSGDCVPSPNSSDGNVTAICRDGSHSHAEHTTGACSHHGGVAQWCPCSLISGQTVPGSTPRTWGAFY